MRRFFASVMSVLLIGAFMICPAFATSSFPDVDENADYAEAVQYVNEMGIMQGDDKGNFNPNNTVTRAEMATILCNIVGETENLPKDGSVFTDVPEDHWANPYVIKAAELGLVSGYGDGRYGPSDMLTYEQAITMVVRAANWVDDDIDIEQLGGYPDGYILLAQQRGLLEDISFNKGLAMSRSEVAIVLYNYLIPPFMRT